MHSNPTVHGSSSLTFKGNIMATKSKATGTSKASKGSTQAPEQQAPEQQAPEQVVANPFANAAQQLTQPAPAEAPVTAHATMLARAAANGNVVTLGGVVVAAAPNVAARAGTINALAATIASTSYTLAKVPKVRATPGSKYTVQCLAGWQAAGLCTVGTVALGSEWAAASTGNFATYAVKNGWLVKA
jgi:cell wall-associated NlpC family hydrolase